MKNITLSINDDTYRSARIAAAQRGTTVSRMVREYLDALSRGADRSDERTADLMAALDRSEGYRASDRLTREEVHERGQVR